MHKLVVNTVYKLRTERNGFAQTFARTDGASVKVEVCASFVRVLSAAFSTQINYILNLLNDGLYTLCTGLTTKTTTYINNRNQ